MSFTKDHLLPLISQINKTRFYNTERGYQGHLNALLTERIKAGNLFSPETIIEEEYQKTIKHHHIRQRPDMIVHIPIEAGLTESRVDNNFYVIALKLLGTREVAMRDFESLDEMFGQLEYPEGLFVNISTYPNTYLADYVGNFKARIHEISVSLANNTVNIIYSHFVNGEIYTEHFHEKFT